MDFPSILLSVGLALLAALFVGLPFLKGSQPHPTGSDRSAQVEERRRLQSALQELEADQALGKLPAGEYDRQRAELTDQLILLEQGEDPLEALIAARRRVRKDGDV